jgi:sorbose reductase
VLLQQVFFTKTANMSMSIEECQTPRAGFPKPVPNTPTNVMQQFSMAGKTIVVTGAAEGIGGAVADAMAEAGGNVALWYNSNSAAITRAETLAKEHNVKTKAYSVNQIDAAAVQKAIQQVVEDFGRIDVFVANAGTGDSKPLLDQTLESYHNLMKVNVDGPVFCAKYAGEVFKKQGFGNLILTSSISAHIVNVPVDQPIYNGTKAFVSHLGKSLAREWREFARVNIVSPGFFDTKMGAGPQVINEGLRMIPLGRQGNVKEIKGLFLYLGSDASSYMTGSDCIIDGGYVLP